MCAFRLPGRQPDGAAATASSPADRCDGLPAQASCPGDKALCCCLVRGLAALRRAIRLCRTRLSGSARAVFPRPALALALPVLLCLCALPGCSGSDTGEAPARAQPVRVGTAHSADVPVYFQGLGTVTPINTVLVKSRVDGELMALHFTEGQFVKAGDLLAEIDPRPYEVQLAQAEGNLARDQALLKNARQDLARYRKLVREQSVSAQQVQNQESVVGQYEGAVAIDMASIADAKLQLTYCRITAPVSGRLGLKQVDLGNMVRASDANGIVVITQMRPMQVVFNLVEKQLPDVLAAMRGNEPLLVEAWDQAGSALLTSGRLLTVDNQIDTSTGTIKAKATFENTHLELFPNQFVNAKLRVKILPGALVIPTAAVQRETGGFFVFLVQDGKVVQRKIRTGHVTAELTVVEEERTVGDEKEGLALGDIVVTDGVDRLRDGTSVTYKDARSANGTANGATDGKAGGAGQRSPGGNNGTGAPRDDKRPAGAAAGQ